MDYRIPDDLNQRYEAVMKPFRAKHTANMTGDEHALSGLSDLWRLVYMVEVLETTELIEMIIGAMADDDVDRVKAIIQDVRRQLREWNRRNRT